MILDGYSLSYVGFYLDGGSRSMTFRNKDKTISVFANKSLSEPERCGKYYVGGHRGDELTCEETIKYVEEKYKKYIDEGKHLL